jgi:hypothetical protein
MAEHHAPISLFDVMQIRILGQSNSCLNAKISVPDTFDPHSGRFTILQ